jgi:phospholipase/lecithinase/hemolysin
MRNRSLIPILCGLSMLFGSLDAQAREWEKLFAFGDSYTDSGAGYIDGNGPTAVVYAALSLHIPFTYADDANSATKGLNFAVSGASTGANEGMRIRPAAARCGIDEALFGRGIQTQVLDFRQRVKSGTITFDPERTLFFLAGGLNDAALSTAETVSNLKREIGEIYQAGGRYFLVAQLPTKIPAFTAISVRLNPALVRIPEDLRPTLTDAHIRISRWGEYFDRVLADPAKYGIKNTTERCAGRALFGEDPMPCKAPDTYFYFHEGHPSTAVHRLAASGLAAEMRNSFQ